MLTLTITQFLDYHPVKKDRSFRTKKYQKPTKEKLSRVRDAFPTAREPVKFDAPYLNEDLVGAKYQAFEDSVLLKLQKAAERQK